MHVNNMRPNILQDKQAAANGRDLRDRDRFGNLTAKRQLVPRKVYPYSSKRQQTQGRYR